MGKLHIAADAVMLLVGAQRKSPKQVPIGKVGFNMICRTVVPELNPL